MTGSRGRARPPLDGPQAPRPPFSLELSEDQQDIRDWVHGFAENVVRPAAAEWDEREETPWPVIQEAAKIGLYGFEALAQFWADAAGLTLPIVNEELFWGDAGIGMSIMGTTLAVAGIFASGTPEQLGEWVPQCYGTRRRAPGRRVLRLRARRRLGRLVASHPRASTTRPRTSGCSTARRPGPPTAASPTSTWSWPRSTRSCGSRGQAALRDPARHARASRRARRSRSTALRASHTADVFLDDCRIPGSCLLGGKEKLDERLARAREGSARQEPGGDADLRGQPPDGGRAGARHRPRRVRVRARLRQGARSSSAGRSSRTRPSRSPSPT